MIGRIWSIIAYMFIAGITCLMAYSVKQVCMQESCFVNGRRTRGSFRDRLLVSGIFVILFGVMALRFGIGNDYRQYTQTAHEVYVGGYVVTEVGFNTLVRFIYWLFGGEYYEIVFAVFAFFTLLFFFKAFIRQSVSFSQSFFLFMTLGLYFQTFNTMRYYLALSMALYSMKYVLDKDYIKFVFWIIIASFFHKSVLIVLPVYFIATFEWKKWHIITGLVISAICYITKGIILKLALILYPSYKNTIYLDGEFSIMSVIRISVVIVLYVWFCIYMGDKIKTKSWYKELRFYGQLNLLAFVASTFFSFLPVVTRIVYYFGVSQLFMIPLIIKNIENTKIKKRITKLIFGVCAIYFIAFLLQAHKDGVGLLPYRSWLFENERYIYK